MNTKERFDIYKKAEDIWGYAAQYDQAIEEMGELIVAINKYKRKYFHGEYQGNMDIDENLIEEIADVKMCLEQLSAYVGEDKVEEMFDKKLEKLNKLIQKMEKEKKQF